MRRRASPRRRGRRARGRPGPRRRDRGSLRADPRWWATGPQYAPPPPKQLSTTCRSAYGSRSPARMRAPPRSPSAAAVSASTAIASNQLESGAARSRGPRAARTPTARRRGRPRCTGEGKHGAVGGNLGVLIGGVAQEAEHLAGTALEETNVDEVDAERGHGFGMLGGAPGVRRLRRRASLRRRAGRRRSPAAPANWWWPTTSTDAPAARPSCAPARWPRPRRRGHPARAGPPPSRVAPRALAPV